MGAWLATAESSGSNMFATCRAEERWAWAVLVRIYDIAESGIVVPPNLLFPVPW